MENTVNIEIPEYVLRILQALWDNGYEAYLAGGCVRDALLLRTPSDYDIATSASPLQTAACFPHCRVVETGIRHGTVTVVSDGHSTEITTFRRDGEYKDRRRPAQVRFTDSPEEDLSRRDFTVNAMAYSPRTGLIDPFGGQNDLKNGVLRCVGDPRVRFGEDALRIMRALRFASVLGFSIHKETEEALFEMKGLLWEISGERIFSELCALLCGRGVFCVMTAYGRVLAEIIPELAPCMGLDQCNPHHIYDVYTHTAYVVAACMKDVTLRLAALFHDIAKPAVMTIDENGVGHFRGHPKKSAEFAEAVLRRLHCDSQTIRRVCRLVELHDVRPAPEKKSLRRYLAAVTPEEVPLIMSLRRADLSAQSPAYHDQYQVLGRTEALLLKLIDENSCLSVKDLKINGDDLIALGVPAGKEIGRILRQLLDAVYDEKIPNSREALLDAAQKLTGLSPK